MKSRAFTRLLAAALLLAVALVPVPASSALAAPTGSITWTVDHAAKTITVSDEVLVETLNLKR